MKRTEMLVAGRPMTPIQYRILSEFYFRLLKGLSKATPIYRGESLEALYNKLGLDINYNDLEILSERLFMYGDKSRYLFSEEYFGQKTGRQFTVREVSRDVFKYIFEKIGSSIKNPNPHNQQFFQRNPLFADYFITKGNLKLFLAALAELPENKLLRIRNYYLRLLHQLAETSYKQKTHLVSTTTSYKIARRFSRGRATQRNVILHAWIPSVASEHFLFARTNLPKYKGVPYDQAEISVLGGLLPHFILGAEISDTKKFLVNPWLFKKAVSGVVINQGFDIDQSSFVRDLGQTRYRGYYEEVNGEIYDHL